VNVSTGADEAQGDGIEGPGRRRLQEWFRMKRELLGEETEEEAAPS
jgi:hypothetical protein